jgi:glucose-1-phosphate cytidylyltransferase
MAAASEKNPLKAQVVILCGGKGARMGGTVSRVKKELVEVGDRPLIWHVMKIFATFGFDDFVLPLGHHGKEIRRYFLEYDRMHSSLSFAIGGGETVFHERAAESDWRLTLVDTGLDANKGARIKRVEKYLETDKFLVTYGDGVGDIDIRALVEYHEAHGKSGTVTGVRTASQYGLMRVGGDGEVSEYEQYPLQKEWTNAGFMVFNRSVLEYLADDSSVDLESGLLARLVAEGQLMMYRHEGFWSSADTFREIQTFNELWRSGRAPWKTW